MAVRLEESDREQHGALLSCWPLFQLCHCFVITPTERGDFFCILAEYWKVECSIPDAVIGICH